MRTAARTMLCKSSGRSVGSRSRHPPLHRQAEVRDAAEDARHCVEKISRRGKGLGGERGRASIASYVGLTEKRIAGASRSVWHRHRLYLQRRWRHGVLLYVDAGRTVI